MADVFIKIVPVFTVLLPFLSVFMLSSRIVKHDITVATVLNMTGCIFDASVASSVDNVLIRHFMHPAVGHAMFNPISVLLWLVRPLLNHFTHAPVANSGHACWLRCSSSAMTSSQTRDQQRQWQHRLQWRWRQQAHEKTAFPNWALDFWMRGLLLTRLPRYTASSTNNISMSSRSPRLG